MNWNQQQKKELSQVRVVLTSDDGSSAAVTIRNRYSPITMWHKFCSFSLFQFSTEYFLNIASRNQKIWIFLSKNFILVWKNCAAIIRRKAVVYVAFNDHLWDQEVWKLSLGSLQAAFFPSPSSPFQAIKLEINFS
jgi:hypothetical protein